MAPNESKVIYQRELPGGGYVNVLEEAGGEDAKMRHARVEVERRADPVRREGHEPPIIARAESRGEQEALAELLEIAQDNVAIAKALLRLSGDGKARF